MSIVIVLFDINRNISVEAILGLSHICASHGDNSKHVLVKRLKVAIAIQINNRLNVKCKTILGKTILGKTMSTA